MTSVPVMGVPQLARWPMYPRVTSEDASADQGYPYGDPRRFGGVGDGATEDADSLTLAMASALASGVYVCDLNGHTYGVSEPVAVSPGVRLRNGGVAALAGFAGNYLLALGAGARVERVTFDGTHVPAPVAAWLGVGAPPGSALYAANADDVLVRDCTFTSFAGGPVFFRDCDRPHFERCRFENVQSYLGAITNAALELYNCDGARVVNCVVDGYNWKAYNMSNCTNHVVTGTRASGGAQNTGHAAHYEDGCTNGTWLACSHAGAGFGFKANNSVGTAVVNYRAIGSYGGVFLQACSGFRVQGVYVEQDAAGAYAIAVEASALRSVTRGLIESCVCTRTVIGNTLNHVGLLFAAANGYPVSGVEVRSCVLENQMLPMWQRNVASAEYSVNFDGVRVITPGSGSLFYPKQIRLRACSFDASADNSAPVTLYSESGVPSTEWEVSDNRFTLGGATYAVWVGLDGTNTFETKVQSFIFRNNHTTGGAGPLYLDLSNTAGGAGTNYITQCCITGNSAYDSAAATAMQLTFGTAQTTRLQLTNNRLYGTAGAIRNIVCTNGAQVGGGVCSGNDVGAITNKPASLGVGL